MSGWIQITALLEAAPDDWSVFAEAFDRFGCPGSLQTDRPPTIGAFLEDLPAHEEQLEGLRATLLELGAREVQIGRIEEQDWSEIWKLHFHPVRIGRRIVVCPSWEIPEAEEGDLLIVLDPGQAFGTGDHPTTRLCLELIEANCSPPPASLLDLGTGSGILAIAAKKLGVRTVDATDIDPIAVDSARENAKRNQVEIEAFVSDGFGDPRLEGQWPIVASNIISATLIRLAPEAARRVAPGGLWIVSGIIEANWPDILAAAQREGLELADRRCQDGWVAAALRKP